MSNLARLNVQRKTGDEYLHDAGATLGTQLLDFWRWSSSDLVSNSTRGVFAEFIVAQALGIALNDVRAEWDAFDLTTPEGITVEVKSAAYLQTWAQRDYSLIIFRMPETKAWSADTNTQAEHVQRQAQVYVFALLAHKDKATLDPLDVSQWRFYVVPTVKLDGRKQQRSISIRGLESLAGAPVGFSELREKVQHSVGSAGAFAKHEAG
ncbi:MAG TPA: hypothetical protein PLC98_25610 [Anaerolineales bacterium]|nr:hypothetical protein [Anaerolineales bacterium]